MLGQITALFTKRGGTERTGVWWEEEFRFGYVESKASMG